MLIVDRDRCRLYELFDARPRDGGTRWTAGSGAIFDLRSTGCAPPAGRPRTPRVCRDWRASTSLDGLGSTA